MNKTNIRQAQIFLDKMISVSKDRCDWMTVHRGLLLKSLMNRVFLVFSFLLTIYHSSCCQRIKVLENYMISELSITYMYGT